MFTARSDPSKAGQPEPVGAVVLKPLPSMVPSLAPVREHEDDGPRWLVVAWLAFHDATGARFGSAEVAGLLQAHPLAREVQVAFGPGRRVRVAFALAAGSAGEAAGLGRELLAGVLPGLCQPALWAPASLRVRPGG
jgi:hypothetical protein